MVVETESALRNQTLSHFIHTFIRNYDRQSAADRTMRSKYVPINIKRQLLAAISACERNEEDAAGSLKISSIAYMGLFIDASCDEIAYYHSVTSSVLQWTVSLYVSDTHVKRIIKTVLDDMGRIGDDDIQFILEKYRVNEEYRSAGRPVDGGVPGVDKLLSFLKPTKCSPTSSYLSYYSQSVMLKLARSLLRNSSVFLNGNVFNIGPDPRDEHVVSPNDEEGRQVYEDYKVHRERLAALAEGESFDNMQRALKRGMVNGKGAATREPPDYVTTPFDQSYSSSDDDDDEEKGEECVDRDPTDIVYERQSNGSFSTVSPPGPEDAEVEEIFRSVDEHKGGYSGTAVADGSETDDSHTPIVEFPDTVDYTGALLSVAEKDALAAPYPVYPCGERHQFKNKRNPIRDTSLVLAEDCNRSLATTWKGGNHRAPNTNPVYPLYRSVPSAVYPRLSRLAAERTTTKITLDAGVKSFVTREQQRICSLSSSIDGDTRTLEKTFFKSETYAAKNEEGEGSPALLPSPSLLALLGTDKSSDTPR